MAGSNPIRGAKIAQRPQPVSQRQKSDEAKKARAGVSNQASLASASLSVDSGGEASFQNLRVSGESADRTASRAELVKVSGQTSAVDNRREATGSIQQLLKDAKDKLEEAEKKTGEERENLISSAKEDLDQITTVVDNAKDINGDSVFDASSTSLAEVAAADPSLAGLSLDGLDETTIAADLEGAIESVIGAQTSVSTIQQAAVSAEGDIQQAARDGGLQALIQEGAKDSIASLEEAEQTAGRVSQAIAGSDSSVITNTIDQSIQGLPINELIGAEEESSAAAEEEDATPLQQAGQAQQSGSTQPGQQPKQNEKDNQINFTSNNN